MVNQSQTQGHEGKVMELVAMGNRVKGLVTLANRTQEMLKIKALKIAGSDLRDAAGQPLEQLCVLVRLRPGEVRCCLLEFDIDPSLPPGTYLGQLLYKDVLCQSFAIHVLEQADISLFPDTIVCIGAPGRRLTKEIVITNRGNVPVTLQPQMSLALSDEDDISRAIASSLRRSGKEGFNKVLDQFAAELADTMVRPATITLEGTILEIEPGEIRKFTVNIRLPRNLKRNRSYSGDVTIYNQSLTLEIQVPGATTVEQDEEVSP